MSSLCAKCPWADNCQHHTSDCLLPPEAQAKLKTDAEEAQAQVK